MANVWRRGGQRGVALIIVLMVLIVVCLGALVLVNGIGNMQRSAVAFGEADEAYNAATAGLNVARGYLAGLAPGSLPVASALAPGTVDQGAYNIGLRELTDQYSFEMYPYDDPSVNVMVFKTERVYQVTSTGTCRAAQRILRATYALDYLSYSQTNQVEKESTTTTDFGVGDQDILSDGQLDLSGDADFYKIHTNKDMHLRGNAINVLDSPAIENEGGTAHGDITGAHDPTEFTPHSATIPVPEIPDWVVPDPVTNTAHTVAGFEVSGSDSVTIDCGTKKYLYIDGDLIVKGNGTVTVTGSALQYIYIIGNINFNGYTSDFDVSGCSSLEDIFITGNASFYGSLETGGSYDSAAGTVNGGINIFTKGDFTGHGNYTCYGSIYATGRVDLNGRNTTYGIVYSGYDSSTGATALEVSGNSSVHGGLYSKGEISVNGQFRADAVIRGSYSHELEIVTTTTETVEVVEAYKDPEQNLIRTGEVVEVPG